MAYSSPLLISLSQRPARAFPLCRKMLYSTPQSAPKAERTGEIQVAGQELIQATACAIVDKLNSGDVTPLDLLDVLQARIKEVDGKVNALPTLCFDRARTQARGLMTKPLGARGL